MKTLRYCQLFLIMLITAILVLACGKISLTPEEMKEVEHFKKAQASFLESSRYLKELTKDTGLVGSMSEDERNAHIKMLTETLTEAKSVSDSTLAKIHQKLPSAYHSIFILCSNYLPPLQAKRLPTQGVPDLFEDIPTVLTDGGDIAPYPREVLCPL